MPAVASGSRLRLREAALPRAAAAEASSPHPDDPDCRAPRALGQAEREAAEQLEAGARGRGCVPRGGEAGGRGGAAPRARRRPGPGARRPPRGSRGSGTPPGPWWGHGRREHHHAAQPCRRILQQQQRFPARPLLRTPRLYCKNGGFFLRIHPDGPRDGSARRATLTVSAPQVFLAAVFIPLRFSPAPAFQPPPRSFFLFTVTSVGLVASSRLCPGGFSSPLAPSCPELRWR